MNSYIITPKNKKSCLEIEIYSKTINNKYYHIKKETIFRGGSFIIHLKHNEMLPVDNQSLYINDYDYEFIELYDGCNCFYNLYDSDNNIISQGEVYEEFLEAIEGDFCILEEEKGWLLEETEYVIYGGYDKEYVID